MTSVPLTPWPAYTFAAVATAATLGLRLALDSRLGGEPALVMFIVPIALSAYLGGMRGGLLATGLSYLAASYYLPPIHRGLVGSSPLRWDQFFAALAGVIVTVMNEALHRARRRGDAVSRELPLLVQQIESERARLVAAQAVASVGSWETDLSSFKVIWSAETHRIFETTADTFRPTHEGFVGLVHPADRVAVNDALVRSIGQPGPQAIEHRLLLPDGRIKFVEERWRSFSDDQGRPVRAIGTCQDITDRKLIENALRESDEKFRQLVDHITDAFWIRSADLQRLHYVSPAFERIWGRSVESLHANPQEWTDFIVAQDRDRVLAAFAALTENAPLDIEYRIARPDGEIRWVRVRGFQVRDAGGTVIRHTGIVTDITDRKRTEAALQESEGRYRALVQWSPEPAAVIRQGTILFVNPAAVRMIGAQSDLELIGRPILGIVHPDSRDTLRARLKRHDEIGGTLPMIEETFVRLDGTAIDVEIQGTSIVYDGEPAVFSSIRDVTRSKHAAEALRSSVEEFRTLAEAVPQLVWIAKADGWNVYFNQRWMDYTGLTREESSGHGWNTSFHPADQPRARDAWAHAMTTVSTYSVECRLRRVDGVYRWWLIRGVPLKDDHGAVRKWFGTCTDIDDLKVAELEISRANRALTMLSSSAGASADSGAAFFEQLAGNMADALGAQGGFVSTLLPGEPLMAQTIAAVVDGTAIDNFIYPLRGTPCEELLTSDTSVISDAVAAQFPDAPRLAALGAQGYVGRRLTAANGQIQGFLFVVCREPLTHVDFVTATMQIFAARASSELERQETDAQVREQAALLDIAHEAIMVKDLDGRIVYWNKGAERTFGWTASEVLGRRAVEVLDRDADGFQVALAALLADGEWQGEVVKSTKDGRDIPVDVRWTLVRDAQGRPRSILALNTDITARKTLESQFLRAQRMESIGTLAGGIAHDLNNMLTPILMSVEMLQDIVTDGAGLDLLATLHSSAQRSADLVRQVLSFARGVEGQRIPVNPLQLMWDWLKVMRDTFPKSIDVLFTPAPGLWTVTGDPTQIHQVFMNLCVNARDAMPGGGRLAIAMDNIVLDQAGAAANADARPGVYVMVRVEDDGAGIPQDVRDRIFEPFFTTKGVGEGTGLGLSTTLAIVKSHGGFIACRSEVGQGTAFDVYLPATTTAAAMVDPAPGLQPGLSRGAGELVLVVDDEPAIRTIARRLLERVGYRVMVACNGVEALSIYALHREDIAVVLTDMAMPIMDGPALILALTSLNPDVRIIGSSGLTTGGSARLAGASLRHFVPKPYTGDALLKSLQQVLESPKAP